MSPDTDSRPPTSVLLPTVAWTDACDDVVAQLRSQDELLIIHDSDTDPVATRGDIPASVRLIAAGSPTACSGKANAIAAGMEAASHDHIVWTDDDFTHPPDWLDTLHRDYERDGPTTELPIFVGRDPLAVLLEPIYALGGTLGTYLGDHAWGGAVIFHRDDLDVDAFLSDLRRTISDDGLLGEHLSITPVRRGRRVPIGGTVRQTIERHVRFNQIFTTHDPVAATIAAGLLLIVLTGCVTDPVLGVVVTALVAGVYALFGIRRLSVLLTVPALFVSLPLAACSFWRDSFVWAGRRYTWHSKFDVEVDTDPD